MYKLLKISSRGLSLALFLILSLSLSSLAYSEEFGTCGDVTGYCYGPYNHSSTAQACYTYLNNQNPSGVHFDTQSGQDTWYRTNDANLIAGRFSAYTEVCDPSQQEPDCSGATAGDAVWTYDPFDTTIIAVPIFHSDGDCLYVAEGSNKFDDCKPYELPDGSILGGCTIYLTPTGDAATPQEIQSMNTGAGESSYTDDTLIPLSLDSTESTTDTTVTSDSVIENDGTIVDTETKVITEVNDSGIKVNDFSDSVTFTNSDGSTTTYTENKVTTTHPDGSITEVITKDTTKDTGDKSELTIDKATGNVTTSTNSGNVNSNNTTTTNNYNSSGSLTGSSSTQSGTAQSGDPGDSEKEGNCGAPGQPPCEVTVSDNSDEYSEQTSKISQLEQQLTDANQEIEDSLKDTDEDYGADEIANFTVTSWTDRYTPFPTTTTCSGEINTTVFGRPFILSPCEKLQPLREILAWVFFVLTIFAVTRIVFHRKII